MDRLGATLPVYRQPYAVRYSIEQRKLRRADRVAVIEAQYIATKDLGDPHTQ